MNKIAQLIDTGKALLNENPATQPVEEPSSLLPQVLPIIQQMPPDFQAAILPQVEQLKTLPVAEQNKRILEIGKALSAGSNPGMQPQAEKVAFVPSPYAQAQRQSQQLMQQIQQMVQQLPPEQQQQIMPQLQQVSQMRPEQQVQALTQLAQQLQQPQEQPAEQGQAPTQGEQEQQQQAPQEGQPQEGQQSDAHSIDNAKVTLTVRELLDLVSGGKATLSRTKVQTILSKHEHDQRRREEEMAQKKQQAEAEQQAAQQQGMSFQDGGIYPQAPQQ